MPKVAIYVRLSQEDKDKINAGDDSQSIKNQKTMLINYCIQRDWEVYKVYNDDDYAGSDRSRPAFNELLKEAREKKFDIVLCKTQSRFTREMELVEKYLHGLFPIWGIRFIGAVDNADTSNKGNKKARQINGLVNEWYLEDMSDNIRETFRSKCRNGEHIGSFACYGYVKDKDKKGHLLVDPEAASIVKEIFMMYADGYGQIKIAQTLNERRVLSPSAYKKSCGLKFQVNHLQESTSWTPASIASILKNQMYLGDLVQHKKENVSYKSKKQRHLSPDEWIITPNTHEPIIERDLWDKVQVRGHKRTKSTKSGKKNKYAGVIKCMHCGSAMLCTTWKQYRYYRCRLRVTDKEACQGSQIRDVELDECVLNEFHQIANELLNKSEVESQLVIKNNRQIKIDQLNREKQKYDGELEKIKKAIKSLYVDKVNQVITEDDYIELSHSFYEDREAVQKNQDRVNQQLEDLVQSDEKTPNKMKLIEQFINAKEVTYAMVDYLIDKIELGHKNETNGMIPIKIYWKF